ncbi:hypothetical protein Taro_042578 [Colocasia esculenta]|uniref:Uncharacterized protein n=1 Tax=Colocasia esculenta TaxID=4460 RepID=A0A843WH82_COLES|nr:hypothetical protein [Colocasia esculenta]
MSFTTCWGRVEELLVAGEQVIKHTKLIFFPYSSATTCATRPLGVDQSLHLFHVPYNFYVETVDRKIPSLEDISIAWIEPP